MTRPDPTIMKRQRPALPNEDWRPIPKYEGYYEISTHGRVWSVPRRANRSDTVVRTVGGRLLKGSARDDGTTWIGLRKDGEPERFDFPIAELVYLTFVGPVQPPYVVGCKDGNTSNLHVDNLYLRRTARGFSNGGRPTPEQLEMAREMRASGQYNWGQIAEHFGVTTRKIRGPLSRQSNRRRR